MNVQIQFLWLKVHFWWPNKCLLSRISSLNILYIWTLCRYKESKEIEAGLKELKIAIANPSCDNEVLRDYFLKLIRKFVFSALDEIYSFKTEKEILAHMAQMREQSGGACAVVAVQRPKIRYVYYIWKYQKKVW